MGRECRVPRSFYRFSSVKRSFIGIRKTYLLNCKVCSLPQHRFLSLAIFPLQYATGDAEVGNARNELLTATEKKRVLGKEEEEVFCFLIIYLSE